MKCGRLYLASRAEDGSSPVKSLTGVRWMRINLLLSLHEQNGQGAPCQHHLVLNIRQPRGDIEAVNSVGRSDLLAILVAVLQGIRKLRVRVGVPRVGDCPTAFKQSRARRRKGGAEIERERVRDTPTGRTFPWRRAACEAVHCLRTFKVLERDQIGLARVVHELLIPFEKNVQHAPLDCGQHLGPQHRFASTVYV